MSHPSTVIVRMMSSLNLKKIPVNTQKPKYAIEEEKLPYYLPSLHLSSKQMPEIRNWEVGSNYKLVIEVNMRSKSEDEKSGKTNASGSLELVAYKVIKEKTIDDMTDEEFGEYQGKELSKRK